MAYKSWKPKNNNYIDGTGIRVNRKTLLDYIFPVGSVYISTNHTNPHDLLGGTWVRIEDGFLYCTTRHNGGDLLYQGNLNNDAKTQGHAISINEMPSHSHNAINYLDKGYAPATKTGFYGLLAGTETVYNEKAVKNTGGGQEHFHSIPYTSVYVWYRTA